MTDIPDEITADEYLALMGRRSSKYKNTPVEIDRIIFASRAEAAFYKELALMEMAGEISQLEIQPEFVLMPAFKRDGRHYRAITYRADFRYKRADGVTVVADVKGAVTQVYAMKRKLLLAQLPEDVVFVEIPASDYSGNAARGRRSRKGRR